MPLRQTFRVCTKIASSAFMSYTAHTPGDIQDSVEVINFPGAFEAPGSGSQFEVTEK